MVIFLKDKMGSNNSSKSKGIVWREGERFKAPDWRQYRVEDIEHLKWTQDQLAKKGLRNPWLRNDVWKYADWPGYLESLRVSVFRGFRLAVAAMIITIAVDKMIGLKRDMHVPHHASHNDENLHD